MLINLFVTELRPIVRTIQLLSGCLIVIIGIGVDFCERNFNKLSTRQCRLILSSIRSFGEESINFFPLSFLFFFSNNSSWESLV